MMDERVLDCRWLRDIAEELMARYATASEDQAVYLLNCHSSILYHIDMPAAHTIELNALRWLLRKASSFPLPPPWYET